MKKDFLAELNHIGFTARIKRLSDSLLYSSIKHYKNIELDVEPNWHLILLLLKKEHQLTVTDFAHHLQFSHPAIVKIVKKMKERGYLRSATNTNDTRKQFLQLSDKAIKELPKFEIEWNRIQTIVKEFVDDDFLQKLGQVEQKLNDMNFSERYSQKFQI